MYTELKFIHTGIITIITYGEVTCIGQMYHVSSKFTYFTEIYLFINQLFYQVNCVVWPRQCDLYFIDLNIEFNLLVYGHMIYILINSLLNM